MEADQKKEKRRRARGSGQIIEKGDREFLVRIFIGSHVGEDGKRKREYFNQRIRGTRTDAEKYLRQKLRELDTGTFVKPTTKTVSEYLDEWLKNSAKQKLSSRTYADQVSCLDRYVRPKLGKKKLSKLEPFDLQEFYTELSEKGLSPRTIQIVHNILNRAFNQAVKWRKMSSNPAQLVDRPKQQRREMQALSPEQATRFLEAAKYDHYFLYFTLALDTGARPSELLALQWKDVDFEQGRVTIQRTLEYVEGSGDFKFLEPKTPRSRRSITISQVNISHLREYKKRQAEVRLKAGAEWQQFDLIFCTREGKPLQIRNVLRRHLRPILRRAELAETFNLYSLRHTCATLLLSAGVNPKIVSERLGHASIVLTLDTYSHVLPDMQQSAADKLDRILFSKVGATDRVGTSEAHQKEKAAC